MSKPTRNTGLGVVVLVLLASVGAMIVGIGGGGSSPIQSVETEETLAIKNYAAWLDWARGVGFEGAAVGQSAYAVRAAITLLSDGELSELNDAIRTGRDGFDRQRQETDPVSNSAMSLASWLFSSASHEQIDRLHNLVPMLEPQAQIGAGWRRYTVALDEVPGVGDIHQGSADDCWLLAGLGAAAVSDAASLTDRILANENGSYTVRWSVDGADYSVTVSPYLPVTNNGDLTYAHATARDEANWSSVFEKSYAALPAFGSYDRLAGGSMLADSATTVAAAIASVTGRPVATQSARGVTLDRLRAAIADGQPVAATTFLTGLTPARTVAHDVPMIDRHVYVVQAIEADYVVLRNPWGYTTSAGGPPTIRLSIEDFTRRVLLVTFGSA